MFSRTVFLFKQTAPRVASLSVPIWSSSFEGKPYQEMHFLKSTLTTCEKNATSCTRLLTPSESFSLYRFVISRTSGAQYICPLSSRTARRTNAEPARAVTSYRPSQLPALGREVNGMFCSLHLAMSIQVLH